MRKILTVTTPVADTSLVSLASAKAALEITDSAQDAAVTAMIKQASRVIATACNRVLVQEVVIEKFWGDRWVDSITLDRFPVSSVTSISEGGVALASDSYQVDWARGILYRLTSDELASWGEATVVASYTGGYQVGVSVPSDIERACFMILKLMQSKDSRDPLVKSEEVPGVLITDYWVGALSQDALPSDIRGLLEPYRRRNV